MPIAAQTKDVDPGLLELLKKEEGALVMECGLLSQGSEAPPVKLRQCVVEVAPGGREKWGVCSLLEVATGTETFPLQGFDGVRPCPLDTHRSYSG